MGHSKVAEEPSEGPLLLAPLLSSGEPPLDLEKHLFHLGRQGLVHVQ